MSELGHDQSGGSDGGGCLLHVLRAGNREFAFSLHQHGDTEWYLKIAQRLGRGVSGETAIMVPGQYLYDFMESVIHASSQVAACTGGEAGGRTGPVDRTTT
jgi:hypothetical protein